MGKSRSHSPPRNMNQKSRRAGSKGKAGADKKKRSDTPTPIAEEHTQAAAERTTAALKSIRNAQQQQSKAAREPSGEPPNKKKKTEDKDKQKQKETEGKGPAIGSTSLPSVSPTDQYSDLGGVQQQLEVIARVIQFPVKWPTIYTAIGAAPAAGVLLHGPPGCGKTKLAHAIAGELKVPLFKISAPEIVSGISGESEAKIRTLFQEATREPPSLIFIDEIDSIAGKRDSASREMERRIVAQLLSCMDALSKIWEETHKVCMVIGATSRPDSLDPALRRAGRFDREISMGIPSEADRLEILKVLTGRMKLDGQVDFNKLAQRTPGFVGADLTALTKEASGAALRRIFNQITEKQEAFAKACENSSNGTHLTLLNPDAPRTEAEPSTVATTTTTTTTSTPSFLNGGEESMQDADFMEQVTSQAAVTWADFEEALGHVQPASTREGFTTIPNVKWDDVGALDDVKEELKMFIQRHIKCPDVFAQYGCLAQPVGVLLYGPPGCGKTLVAKAIASESGANFISIKGPELLNKFVGESERSVRTVFARAAASAPCVLFFDELDALAPKRSSDSGNAAAERVVNQLLTELDGVKARDGVYVIGASNRVDMIDSAMLRPGRLDKPLYVPLPNEMQRRQILRAAARNCPIAEDVDLDKIASKAEFFSGADLAALTREASIQSVREYFKKYEGEEIGTHSGPEEKPLVNAANFEVALKRVQPSVSLEDRKRYADMERKRK
eukprot:TRINITY_DN60061_c0_g1_i1.p1 TRINITY_DN60061_c0_g1~~TRINITY_DN60061_c0_g1_i1.p1  ORF type:complete len:730 (+),score=88.51 TRINITY_DN60061_c0_g1_i1:92-2281(+)